MWFKNFVFFTNVEVHWAISGQRIQYFKVTTNVTSLQKIFHGNNHKNSHHTIKITLHLKLHLTSYLAKWHVLGHGSMVYVDPEKKVFHCGNYLENIPQEMSKLHSVHYKVQIFTCSIWYLFSSITNNKCNKKAQQLNIMTGGKER